MSDVTKCYRAIAPGKKMKVTQRFPNIHDINPYSKEDPYHALYNKIKGHSKFPDKKKLVSIKQLKVPTHSKRCLIRNKGHNKGLSESVPTSKSRESSYKKKYTKIKRHLLRMREINQSAGLSPGKNFGLGSFGRNHLPEDRTADSPWKHKRCHSFGNKPSMKLKINYGDVMQGIKSDNLYKLNTLIHLLDSQDKGKNPHKLTSPPRSIAKVVSLRQKGIVPRPDYREKFNRLTRKSWSNNNRKLLRPRRCKKIGSNDKSSTELSSNSNSTRKKLPRISRRYEMPRSLRCKSLKKDGWWIIENANNVSVASYKKFKRAFESYVDSRIRHAVDEESSSFDQIRPTIKLKEIV